MNKDQENETIFNYLNNDIPIQKIEFLKFNNFFETIESFIRKTNENNLNSMYSTLHKGASFKSNYLAFCLGKMARNLIDRIPKSKPNYRTDLQEQLLESKESLLAILKIKFLEKNLSISIEELEKEFSTFNNYKLKKYISSHIKCGYFNNLATNLLTIESTNDISKQIIDLNENFCYMDFITSAKKLKDFFEIRQGNILKPLSALNDINELLTYSVLTEVTKNILRATNKDGLESSLKKLDFLINNTKNILILNNDKYDIKSHELIQKNLLNLINKIYYYDDVNTELMLEEFELYEKKTYLISVINTILKNKLFFNQKVLNAENHIYVDVLSAVVNEHKKYKTRMTYLTENYIIDNLTGEHLLNIENKKINNQLIYLNRTLETFEKLKQSYKQEIIIGPVGSGKSNYVKNLTQNNKTYRIVFSPSLSKEDFIGYINGSSFIPGIFTIFYAEALANFISKIINFYYQENPFEEELKHFLVIEELNRGYALDILDFCSNLLDRTEGFSSYPIYLNEVQKEWISSHLNSYIDNHFYGEKYNLLTKIISIFPMAKQFLSYSDDMNYYKDKSPQCIEDDKMRNQLRGKITVEKILLLPNMNILCTMNSYDNNIYDLDYMLFRRFSIKHITHSENSDLIYIEGLEKVFEYSWNNLINVLNKKITLLENEEKCLAFYFLSGNDYLINDRTKIIKKEAIKNKLVYFLYHKVFKDNKKEIFGDKNFSNLLSCSVEDLYEMMVKNQDSNLDAISKGLKND